MANTGGLGSRHGTGELGIMGRNAARRAASDAGLTTGAATTVLALLSAGAVASISLVGAHQLAPAISERLRASGPSVVQAPKEVVVTPRTTPTPSGPGRATHPAKPTSRAPSPDGAVVLVAIVAPVAQRDRAPAVPRPGPAPTIAPPTVDPAPPSLPKPTVSPDTKDPVRPPRRDNARHDDDGESHHHGRHCGRHHRDGDGDDRGRGQGHDGGYGDDHLDRHDHEGDRGNGRHRGGGSGDDDRNGRHHSDGRNQGGGSDDNDRNGRHHGDDRNRGGHDDSRHDRHSR